MMRHLLLACMALILISTSTFAQDVRVLAGLDDTIEWFESMNWWGDELSGDQLKVPHTMLVAISDNWRTGANDLPVPLKKKLFFRFMLPLILHANQMVVDRRERLKSADAMFARGETPSAQGIDSLRNAAVLLRIRSAEEAAKISSPDEWRAVIAEALYKLDVIPTGLAMAQATVESGYATSRFAAEGNALFGQWTFGGEGLAPEQQRKQLGDHRIAAFDWPFDSVRGYFLNLSSHPAYEAFRKLRAKLREEGKPITSMALVDGLANYSERGEDYLDDLRAVIRVNKLDLLDAAEFRDEPVSFVLGAGTEENAAEVRARIEEMRASGDIEEIVARMRLD